MNSSLFYQTQTYFQRSKHKKSTSQFHKEILEKLQKMIRHSGIRSNLEAPFFWSYCLRLGGFSSLQVSCHKIVISQAVEGQTKEEMRLIQLSDENNIKKLEKISQYVWRLKQILAFIDKLMSDGNNKLMRPHMQEDIFLRFLAEEK